MAIGFRSASSNSADSGTASLTLPSGTANGDCLVMMLSVYSGSVTWSDPAGWTNLAGSDVYITHASLMRSKIWVKIASGESDPSITLSGTRRWSMSCAAYTGVDQTTPVNTTENTGWSKAIDAGTGAVTTGSLTGGSNQWLVAIAGGADDTTHTWTDDRTERTDNASPVVASACASTSLADSNGTVSGAVTCVLTPSVTMQNRAAVALLLNEASTASLNRPTIFGTVW